ncbi:MAG: transcription termination factor NusA [Emcibacteraceae bacterium]|jgi:transcription termination/antitermination protein NusA|uniref:transcription termination factor NusA n=1 Tax=Pseudemcibacter sp. TaxID=2943293 RepID=UPI003F6A1BCF|nr:transcription termination/antitermination protein NusA [Kordiimonadaceae bacterium]MDG1020188.1 transcription termination factor NusA [Emcibacteraceae bacterium]MDG1726514.1 transcription termination factor NusA [Emcibacteraceae bacterium]
MTAVSANRLELLQISDAVAREKSIDKEIVLGAMEEAIQKAARSRYGMENEIKAHIDRKSGDIKLYRVLEVVENVENHSTEITVADAVQYKDNPEVGDILADELPAIDFGRVAAQTAKQVIVQKVREAERARQYEEYKDKIGDMINGVVKRVEYGNVIVDLGAAEAIIRRDQLIAREHIRNGERVRAIILDVREEPRGPQIFLSRSHPDFMVKLFAGEVPEIYDGVIGIVGVSRDPGSRAKIAVTSNDPSIDPVGACVGMRGSRVQAVVEELQGEKIDIIQWSPDPATYIIRALAPANVTKVVIDEDAGRMDVVVGEDQLSLAIGRRGQNVRLGSQLTGWQVDIMTEADESERRQAEYKERSELFMNSLDVDETLALLLVGEGFRNLEEVAYVAPDEFAGIEGFDIALVEELQNRAREALANIAEVAENKRLEMGVSDELTAIEGLTAPMLVTLGEAGVKTLDDLGDLAGDELTSQEDGILRDYDLTLDQANEIIMAARAHWFDDEDEAAEEEASEAEAVPEAE